MKKKGAMEPHSSQASTCSGQGVNVGACVVRAVWEISHVRAYADVEQADVAC